MPFNFDSEKEILANWIINHFDANRYDIINAINLEAEDRMQYKRNSGIKIYKMERRNCQQAALAQVRAWIAEPRKKIEAKDIMRFRAPALYFQAIKKKKGK